MGREYDLGAAEGFDPRWQAWYDGTHPVKRWIAELALGQIVAAYDDYLNHFNFDAYPTFAVGVGTEFSQADESWGPRPFPSLPGDPAFGFHITKSLMADQLDLTVCQELTIRMRHKITASFSRF